MIPILIIAGLVTVWLLSGDAVQTVTSAAVTLAEAIAIAEGYGVVGATPTIRNNPGDIKGHGGTITQFATPDEGWAALYAQCGRIISGSGTTLYSPSMTIQQIGDMYVNGGQRSQASVDWARNVATYLGVSTDTTVGDWEATV